MKQPHKIIKSDKFCTFRRNIAVIVKAQTHGLDCRYEKPVKPHKYRQEAKANCCQHFCLFDIFSCIVFLSFPFLLFPSISGTWQAPDLHKRGCRFRQPRFSMKQYSCPDLPDLLLPHISLLCSELLCQLIHDILAGHLRGLIKQGSLHQVDQAVR